MAKEKKQITRNRISYSCQKCRQRKVKCDKVHPVCGSCEKTGEECVYLTNENDTQSVQEAAQSSHDNNRKRQHSPTESQDGDALSRNHIDSSTHLENQLSRLSNLLIQLRGITETADATETIISRRENVLDLHDAYTTSRPQQSRHYAQSQDAGDETQGLSGRLHTQKYDDNSSTINLEAVSAQLGKLTDLLQSKQNDLSTDSDGVPLPISLFTHIKPQETAEPANKLFIPSEGQRNALFRSWLSYVYPVLPIIDPHVVLMNYRTFHFWYLHGLEKGIPNPAEEHVPLIFAVYYAGIISLSIRGFRKWFPGAHRQSLLESSQKQFLQTLQASAKLLSNPATLAARVMMCYLTSQNVAEIVFNSTTASLTRTAYACNLHRERPNTSLEHARAATRRRLWWEVVNLDSLEATASNMPPSINQLFHDTILLSELKDFKMGTSEAIQYEAALQGGRAPDLADDLANNEHCSMVSVVNIVMKARTILSLGARQLLDINLAVKPKTREDMVKMRKTLSEVATRINAIIARIPVQGLPELDFTPNRSKSGQSLALDHGKIYGDDLLSSEIEAIHGVTFEMESWQIPYITQHRMSLIVFHKWARIALSMLIDQLHCFSYAPFLSNPKRKLWVSARQCALRHAHSCLRKFNVLGTDLEFERFRWAWSRMYQPIHACMIILLDVHEHPTSREAPRSRALLDQMLSLSLPGHDIVGGEDGLTSVRPLQESGNEAYVMLMQLRAKGWHKAGLDPTLLWTEQDQIDVGVATPLTDTERMAQSIREDAIPFDNKTEHEYSQLLLYPIISNRAKEYTHPSILGPPEDADNVPPCSERVEPINVPNQNGRLLLRARSDQERAPFVLAHDIAAATGNQPGPFHKFKLPSELYDVGELIKRIKSFQNSRKVAQNDDSTQRTGQTATAENELAGSSSRTLRSDDSGKTTGVQSISTVLDSRNRPRHPVSAATPSQTVAQHPLPTTPSAAQQVDENESNPTLATNPSSQTQQEPLNPETPIDLVKMDFDWAKWDETFGHILDETFDAVTPGAMEESDAEEDEPTSPADTL